MQLYDTYSTNPRAFKGEPSGKVPLKVDRSDFSMDFQCLFRHFSVPRNLQDDVWRSVRHSLDKRGARIRQMMRTKQITGFRTSTPVSDLLQELGYFNSTTEKEVV
ncbi:hypothetical protein GCK32_021941 [Trichostrongylus colubriformis]|uniref:Uncharacterized protein n=1 Tax=Trichostrongylus colubriformis TaxID=6319 RepID=A0AAN8IRQ8_TRICO